MPPRASWTGYLKLSLVAIPVRMYNAISSASKISLNQLHKNCHQRIRQQLLCPVHGNIGREDVGKGYELEKDKYVVLDEADLEKVRMETTKTIELTQFVDPEQLEPIYLDSAYYVAPDGAVAEEAFRVIREAMRQKNKVGIGRVVMSGKETTIALQIQDKGFRLHTLHAANEIRHAASYFEEIPPGDVNKDQLALAMRLVENNTNSFDPAQFSDRYQEALLEIIKAKIEGTQPVLVPQAEVGKVINLMDALRRSVAQSQPRKVVKRTAAASAKIGARQQRKLQSA